MTERRFAWCGVLAPIVFILALLVFSALRPNYSQLTHAVSELGVAGIPHAVAWNVIAFMLVGFLIVGLAWALRVELQPGPAAVAVPLLTGISGIGFVGLGVVPADPGFSPSLATSTHFAMVSVNYLAFIFTALVFAIKLRNKPYWKPWALVSGVIGVMAVASIFIPGTVPAGLSQRIGIGTNLAWLFVIGLALLRKSAPVP